MFRIKRSQSKVSRFRKS